MHLPARLLVLESGEQVITQDPEVPCSWGLVQPLLLPWHCGMQEPWGTLPGLMALKPSPLTEMWDE